MRHAAKICLMGVAVAALGCTVVRNARLYDLQSADVLTATYKSNGTGHGNIWIGPTLENADCKGEYVTVPQGTEGWGMIYRGITPTLVTTGTASTDQAGRAVVTCRDRRVIECEYITSSWTAKGSGACQDNQGHRYRLIF